MDPNNPLRLISNSCTEMRQLSQALQAARGNAATDVSDVFDISSSILTTILKETSDGIDPNEKILETMKKVNQILATKERNFKSKMDELLLNTSQKVTEISDHLKSSNFDVNYVLENVKKIKEDFLAKSDQDNQKKLEEFQKKLKEEEEDKKKEEKAAYENFESYLSQVMADITQTYNQRLKQADDLNDNLQIKLQTSIHNKHQEKSNRSSYFENEEKRVIKEREKLTAEFNEYKEKVEQKILMLKQKIEKLKAEINQNKNSNNSILQQRENELISKQKDLMESKNDELKKLGGELNSLLLKKSQIESDISNTQNQLKEKINQLINENDEKVQKIRNDSIQMIEKTENEIEQKFKPQIDDLLNEIKSNENQKNSQENQFRDKHNEEDKEIDKDVQELIEQKDKETSVIKVKLNGRKKELRSIQNQRNKDLEKVKNEKVKILAAAKQKDEEKVQKRASIINELMKQFDATQQKLYEKKFITLEEMNKRRDALIKKLEQIGLEEIDKIKDDDIINYDKEYEYEIKLLKEEFYNHKSEMNSLQNKIQQINERIENLNLKIKKVERTSIRVLEKYVGIDDEELEDDVKKSSLNGSEKAGVSNISNRIEKAAFQIEQKTKILRQEAEEITNSINSAHDLFERKMDEIELHLKSGLYQLKMRESELDERKETINKKIVNQKKTIIELEKALSQKNLEFEQFKKTINEKKIKFEKETKEKFESDLNVASQKPINLHKEMDALRNSLSIEINKLKSDLENAQLTTSKISEFCLNEREKKKNEEAQNFLSLHNEQMKKIETDHDEKMNKLIEKLINSQNDQKNNIKQIELQFNQLWNQIFSELKSKIDDLNQQKQSFLIENQNLNSKYEDLKINPCQECQKKKELIKKLLQTKKTMEKQVEQHQEILQKNDQNMNVIFGVKKKQVATPLLDMPKNQQHAPVIAKPGSGPNRAKSQLNQKPSSANSRFHQGVSSALAPSKNNPM